MVRSWTGTVAGPRPTVRPSSSPARARRRRGALHDERYLFRWTMVVGGPWAGLMVTDIAVSVQHASATIELFDQPRP